MSAMNEYKDSPHMTLNGGALELFRLLTEFTREDRNRFASLVSCLRNSLAVSLE